MPIMTPSFSRMAVWSFCWTLLFSSPVLAQAPGVQGAAEREIHRLETLRSYAQKQINLGAEAMMSRDYESAFSYYKSAVDALPSGGEATASLRRTALDGFSRAAISLARQRISEGRYADAQLLVDEVLSADYDPENQAARQLADQLRDPARFNQTITPNFVADVEEVKRLLGEADGFYQSGRYDLAFRRYEQVLNIDKYNIAARRGMERVNLARSQYADTAYSETRGQMLSQVSAGWELPVRRFDTGLATIIEQPEIDLAGTAAVNRKLDNIIIPSLEFSDATVREAVDFIKRRAFELDTSEPDPSRRGVNIVLVLDREAEAAGIVPRISFPEITQVSLRFALEQVVGPASLKLKVEPYAVAIVPLTAATEVMLTKEYPVQPSFIQQVPSGGDGFGGGFGSAADTAGRSGAKQFLEAQGVSFPDGATAYFVASSSKLIVRNTQSNLDLVDALVDISNEDPDTQVEIQSKFLEVTQNNLQELGFDWLLGQFAMPFGSGVFGSGGTQGNQPGAVNAQGAAVPLNQIFPMADGAGVPFGLSNPSPVPNPTAGTGQVTAGNRSGSTAIRANALDGLLFASPVGPAAGVMTIAGVFTNPQFQVVIRALDQAKGIDLLSAPTITTNSGQKATIEVVREFIYPSDYDPPQVPQEQSSGSVNPAIPATPSQFTMEPVGVVLEVEPIIGEDFTIELNLAPKVTEFEGFVNYGSPINTTAPSFSPIGVVNAVGEVIGFSILPSGTQTIELTPNFVNQPVFSVREVTTNVTIYDGQTIVIGGLMREDIQKVEDKTPIIGDIPLVGRLFRSSSSLHQKRNLIIFVTATLVDPAGQPLLVDEEDGDFFTFPSQDLLLEEIIPGDASSLPAQF
jgi:general secretion pathway protein D